MILIKLYEKFKIFGMLDIFSIIFNMYFATEMYDLDNVSIVFLLYLFKIILFCSKIVCP